MGATNSPLKKIVVVCTGNTCRSPMAAGWLTAHLAGKGWQAESAGVAAREGGAAAPEAVEVMQEMEVDISTHRSRMLSRELVEEADLILAMTEGHLRVINQRFPEAKEKVQLLNSFGPGPAADVADPFGLSADAYRHTRDELVQALGDFLLHLAERGGLKREE